LLYLVSVKFGFISFVRRKPTVSIKGILRPSHVCFIFGTLPTGTLTVCIPKLFPPKEKYSVGLLRFDDDHDHICYRFAQVRIFAGKSNVFRSLQPVPVVAIISQNCGLFSWSKYIKLFGPHTILIYFAIKLDNVLC
jgi:hypothetical protein